MSEKPVVPRPRASAEQPRRPPGRFDATTSFRRLRSYAYTDPVDDWKREALTTIGAGPSGPQTSRGFTLRVKAGFVLLVMVAGAPRGVVGWAATLLTFLSVMFVQELPSLLWARGSGRAASVVFSARGSDTLVGRPAPSAARTFALALFGSLSNLAVALAVWLLVRRGLLGSAAPLFSSAALVHAFWGSAQVLPLAPFRVGRAIAGRLRPPLRFAYAALSLVLVGVVGLWALRAPGFPVYFSSFMLAIVAATSALLDAFNELQDDQSGVGVLTVAAATRLREDQPEQALELARRALASARVEANRTTLYRTIAWAAIGKGDPFIAHSALGPMPAHARDLHLVAAYLACCNRADEAIELLGQARCRGHRAAETSKLLVDLLFQSAKPGEALEIAEADEALLGAENLNAIHAAVTSRFSAGTA